jgi:hypothetical protein
MSPEEWKAHVQQWQQRGGQESAKTPDPKAAASEDNSDGGYLGSAMAFGKGMLREGASQIGVAKDFAEGKDPEHETAEWLGRETTDFAPAIALDAVAPELAFIPAATRIGKLGNFANQAINAGMRGAVGGAIANPDDRKTGAQSGGEIGAGSSMLGQVMASRPVHRMLLPAAILAEIAQHGGAIPHGALGGLYPWAMAHGLSALGGLARAAGFSAPATTGAVGSQAQRYIGGDQGE